MKLVTQYIPTKRDAGPKAKVDIENILKREYSANIQTLKLSGDIVNKKQLYTFRLKKAFFLLKNIFKTDILIIQAPFSKNAKINIPANKKIVIIHDIEGLRTKNSSILDSELNLYNSCNVIISHNEIMSKFLRDNSVTTPIIDLEIFDYLFEGVNENLPFDINNPVIAYAGNLNKSPFIYSLDSNKMKFKLNLYGVGVDKDINDKILFKGSFTPNDLPKNIKANLGLVWDGECDSSDEFDNLKNYTKYNNPHKLSCYIAAGIPVIVWRKSAAASFVKKYDIGYTVNDIYEINNLDFSDYNKKLKNIEQIRNKIIDGYFTKKAINKALKLCKEE